MDKLEAKIAALYTWVGKFGKVVDLDGVFTSDILRRFAVDGVVSGSQLAANSVNGDKITDGSITVSKLNSGSVGSVNIVDGAIASVDLADSAVSTVKIANLAVSTSKIASLAVTTDKLADFNILASKLDADCVTTAKLINDAVTTGKIINSAITSSKIAAGAVPYDKFVRSIIVNFQGANVSIPNVTQTLLQYNSSAGSGLSGGALASDSVFTAPATAVYRISCHMTFVANATGSRALSLMVGGVRRSFTSVPVNSAGESTSLYVCKVLLLNAGDVVTVSASQTSGGAINSMGGQDLNSFQVEQLTP